MSDPTLVGSIISVVSKSNIRYEGILHEYDYVEATVALESGKFINISRKRIIRLNIFFIQ